MEQLTFEEELLRNRFRSAMPHETNKEIELEIGYVLLVDVVGY